MSSSASFWAAKSDGVKSPPAPADVAKPVSHKEPFKKSAIFLKSTSSSHHSNVSIDKPRGATTSFKKTDWADSDDEEEFLASFASSARIQELEKIIFAKESCITDLSISLQEKESRIAELESASKEQTRRLTELQGIIDDSTALVESLRKNTHKQDLRVQQLVAIVDEKDRRIVSLESEVDEHCATIAVLEAGDNSTEVSSHDSSDVLNPDHPAVPPKKVEVEHNGAKPFQQAEQLKVNKHPINEIAVANFTKTTPTKVAGPAVNLSLFPIFATEATVKQTAPPPPAPKLKMPVDMSKFAKKPTAKPVASKKNEATLGDARKDERAPKIDPSTDIRTKSHEERLLFANGPKVQVKMGDMALATVPKYVLMQCSHKAFKHFSENPDATSFQLPASSMDAAAASSHLTWMKEMTHQRRVYSITLHSDEKLDDKNLQICRAARVLGLNNMYVGHFTKLFCDRIRSDTASDSFVSNVAALAYPENDPIYDCLANNLANFRLRNAVKNLATLEALLQRNKGLKAKIEKIEDRMRSKQESAKPSKGPKVVHVGKKLEA